MSLYTHTHIHTHIYMSSLSIHPLTNSQVVFSPPSFLVWSHSLVDSASDESLRDQPSSSGPGPTCYVTLGCHFILQSLNFLICEVGIVIPALFFLEDCCENPGLNRCYGNAGVCYCVCALKYFYVCSQSLVPQSPSLLMQ